MTNIEIGLYAPPYGFEIAFHVELHKNYMEFKRCEIEYSKATWVDESDPEWSNNDMIRMLESHGIFPPSKVRDYFETAWKGWRSGELDDEQIKKEIQLIAGWINAATSAMPDSEFWKDKF